MDPKTRKWWGDLPDAARNEILDAAVWGAGWYALAREMAEGYPLHRPTLSRLVDDDLYNGA